MKRQEVSKWQDPSNWKAYPWKAYPTISKYLRVVEWEGKAYIQACRMMRDGSMDLDESGVPHAWDVKDWRQLHSDLFNLPIPVDREGDEGWKQKVALLDEISKD